MPRTNLGKNLPGLALAGLLAYLAGCVPPPPPPAAARANLHNSKDGEDENDNWLWKRATGQTKKLDNAPIQRETAVPPAVYPQNNATGPAPYGTSATMTTRYADPNVVPAGATAVAPAGSTAAGTAAASPYEVTNAPTGPPPGYAGPGPSVPMTISPVSTVPKKSDEDTEWDISQLAPDVTWKKFKDAIGWGADQRQAQEAYDKGLALFKAKNYDEAAKEFYAATWRWPDSTLEEDAMFLMGESYFFADHYSQAQDTFSNLLKKHDNTRYLDTVVARLFAIGTYWEQLDLKSHHWPVTPNATDRTQPWFDTFGNALACYSSVWMHDPTGPLADAALMRVGNAHFRRGEWEEASNHYGMLRKNHPKSKYQKDAHLFELQAKMQIYQGPKYSVLALKDAEEIADQTLKQFPGQLGEEERRVRDARAVLFEQRAEREWVMAQYYDNKTEFRAAREYYKVLLEKYSRSSYAELARKRMQEIKNEPDEPPDRFTWLTGLFGKGK